MLKSIEEKAKAFDELYPHLRLFVELLSIEVNILEGLAFKINDKELDDLINERSKLINIITRLKN